MTQTQAADQPDDVGNQAPCSGPGFGDLRAARAVAAVLLLAGIVLPLWVRSCAVRRRGCGDSPFPTGYQLAWVFVAALLVGSAFILVTRDERTTHAELSGGAVLPDHDALNSPDEEQPA